MDTTECPPKDWKDQSAEEGTEPQKPVGTIRYTNTHTLGAPEEGKERGRKNISRNNGWKIPTSDENHYFHIFEKFNKLHME